MIHSNRIGALLYQIHKFPLSLLSLSMRKRVLIVLLSYGLGISGLWFFFPRLNNATTMILPIICACWLFRYRGLLFSMLSIISALWLIYRYLLNDHSTVRMLVERATLALIISFLLGLTICWLRIATDLVHEARQQTTSAEQKHLQATMAYEQQRRINDLKDQFLLNVSHELRIPLTVLGSSLELLKEYDEQLDPLKREQMLTKALTSQKALVDLVNQVLDSITAVSEASLVKPEAVNVHQLLQEVLMYLASEDSEAFTICLHIPEQMMVWADPQLLRQVLQNLLINAFKYVPRQTEIHIEATQAMPFSEVCLSIQDAGPGIPAEELPLLFEKFVRLKRDLAGTTRGMGLGLYICKRLVNAMNGHIWVESSGRPGEGCRFCLTLPPFLPSSQLDTSAR